MNWRSPRRCTCRGVFYVSDGGCAIGPTAPASFHRRRMTTRFSPVPAKTQPSGQRYLVVLAEAPVRGAGFPLNDVVIDPLRDQTPSLIDRGFGMVDAVERGAGLEGQHVVGADLSKLLIRRDNGPFRPTGYL